MLFYLSQTIAVAMLWQRALSLIDCPLRGNVTANICENRYPHNVCAMYTTSKIILFCFLMKLKRIEKEYIMTFTF